MEVAVDEVGLMVDPDLPSVRSDVFFKLKDTFLPPHSDTVKAICVDHTARRLYSAGCDDVVYIYALESRDRVGELPHGDWVNGVALMDIPPDRTLASPAPLNQLALSHSVNLFSEGSVAPMLPRTEDTFLIVTGCEDGAITFWSPSSYRVVHQLTPGPGPITSLTVWGDIILATSLHTVFMVLGATGAVVREFTAASDQLCCLLAGDQLWSGTATGHIVCWDLLSAVPLRETVAHGGSVRCLLAVPPGENPQNDAISEAFVSGGDDGTIAVWSLGTGTCLRRIPHFPGPTSGPFRRPLCAVRALTFHLRGKEAFLYAAGSDGRISCHALRAERSGIVHAAVGECLAMSEGAISAGGRTQQPSPPVLLVGEVNGAVRALPTDNPEANVVAGVCI